MKLLNQLILVMPLLIIVSCHDRPSKITSSDDYDGYLEIKDNEMLQFAMEDFKFWEKKLEKEPDQFPYLAKAAASQSQIFSRTGHIEALIKAEENLKQANVLTKFNKSGYLRALARNYISQHRFKESLELLKKAEANGEALKATQKMLFDVYLELGSYQLAKSYLDKISDDSDFDYLIRLSKWSDHRGNLDAAIRYMEQAKVIAESSNVPPTKQWVYTNLADYYGHAGNIQASYTHYLKALKLDPSDAYAKKGIAWIVYSHEKNADEALRILNAVTKNYNAPDYYLLKAEIAEYKQDLDLKNEQLRLYDLAMQNKLYGDMYNKYNALLLAEENESASLALKIANEEIENRPTAQSYDLLAWTHFKNGNLDRALEIVESYVNEKTFEPEVLYHVAEIYKSTGKIDESKRLKKELLESTFELGPLMEKSIHKI
ncbi:cell surface protein [Flavivirga sp. 57AJ16]|uniref:tetratricopeptide repeat protein n=1 Tax=Flavivirga sp. 57AJ16 TaxID=3025307 RepID=UPI0023662C2D|nr:cell surface protein [Flavivirga sp. 57AJ16]MDD7887067.1 cell surface protein [Flavivirga sp. 57AJ16]